MIEYPKEIYNLDVPGPHYTNGRNVEEWVTLRSSSNYQALRNYAKRKRLPVCKISKKPVENQCLKNTDFTN